MKVHFNKKGQCIYKAMTWLNTTGHYCTYAEENAYRLAEKIDETFGAGVKGILCPVFETSSVNQYYSIEVIIEDPADEAFFVLWANEGIEI